MSNHEFLNRTQTLRICASLPYIATMIVDQNILIRGVNKEVLKGRHLLPNTLYDQHFQDLIKNNPKFDELKIILGRLKNDEKMVIVSNFLPGLWKAR